MSDLMNIGVRSLQAYETALTVTSQNMGNVSNPFYSRRIVSFTEGMYYNGVVVSDVQRIFDQTASNNLQTCNSNFGMSNILAQQMSQLEQLIDVGTNSIGSYISNALSTMRELNTSPSDNNSRSLYLQQLNILTNRFNDISSQMLLQQQNTNDAIQSVTNDINQITNQIAIINQEISSSPNIDVSSLLDQRIGLVQSLAQYCDFSTQTDADNVMTVTFSNGTLLVVGNNAYQMITEPNANNPLDLDLSLQTPTGTIPITNYIHSGEIGGQLAFLANSLEPTQRALDRLAMSIMYEFNNQNQLGLTGYGDFGSDIFLDINDPSLVADRCVANVNNTGSENINVTINNAELLTTDTYALAFSSSTAYTLTRSDGTLMTSGTISSLPQQISADGFSVNIESGTIKAGDIFTISPAANSAAKMAVALSDPQLLALAWPIATQPGMNNSGNAAITIQNVLDVTNGTFSTPGQLNPPILIQFTSGTTYDIVNASTSAVIQSGLTYNPSSNNQIFPTASPVNMDPGYRVSITGVANKGDTFNINFNTNYAADNKNGKAMEALFAKGVLANGTLTFNGTYDNFSNQVSTQTNGININYESNNALLNQAQLSYSQISGVSVEEEYINLSRYQEAYQASAQIIQVAKSVFDTIIGLGRG